MRTNKAERIAFRADAELVTDIEFIEQMIASDFKLKSLGLTRSQIVKAALRKGLPLLREQLEGSNT